VEGGRGGGELPLRKRDDFYFVCQIGCSWFSTSVSGDYRDLTALYCTKQKWTEITLWSQSWTWKEKLFHIWLHVLTHAKSEVKVDSRFDRAFAKNQRQSKSNFSCGVKLCQKKNFLESNLDKIEISQKGGYICFSYCYLVRGAWNSKGLLINITSAEIRLWKLPLQPYPPSQSIAFTFSRIWSLNCLSSQKNPLPKRSQN